MSAYAERLRFGLSDSLVLARRNLAHIRQIPEKLIDVTVQPLRPRTHSSTSSARYLRCRPIRREGGPFRSLRQ